MQNWILAALGLHVLYIYLPAGLYYPQVGFHRHVRGRDDLPQPRLLAGRAKRALANYQENLPLFLGLAFLVMLSADANHALAEQGAVIFLLARLAYLPLYLAAIPMTRSIAFTVSLLGLGMMVAALL